MLPSGTELEAMRFHFIQRCAFWIRDVWELQSGFGRVLLALWTKQKGGEPIFHDPALNFWLQPSPEKWSNRKMASFQRKLLSKEDVGVGTAVSAENILQGAFGI